MDTLISRCQELKQSIAAFIIKLETEYDLMNWQSFLDNFALISGQINNMMKVIKSDRTPAYRNRIVLPLLLSPDHDEELFKLTEGRVAMFNHDMCPDYLRTKPIPEIEAIEKRTTDKMAKIPPENVSKMINNHNKIVNKMLGGFWFLVFDFQSFSFESSFNLSIFECFLIRCHFPSSPQTPSKASAKIGATRRYKHTHRSVRRPRNRTRTR